MSRYSSYDDAAAVCPYYKGGTATDVRCEGIVASNCVIMRFECRDAKNMFRATYCDRMDGYQQCPIKRAHE